MSGDYLPDLIAELQRHGVTEWRVDRRHRHLKLYFHHQCREKLCVTSRSPSDRFGRKQALAALRRQLGVKNRSLKTSANPRRCQRPERPVEAPSALTLRPNALEKLERVRDPLERRLQEALWRLDVTFKGSFEAWLNR